MWKVDTFDINLEVDTFDINLVLVSVHGMLVSG
jgi:hypothetical protein